VGLPRNQKPLAVVVVAAVAAAVGAVYSRNWAVCRSQSTLVTFCNLPTRLWKLGLHSHCSPKFQFHSALLHPTQTQVYLQNIRLLKYSHIKYAPFTRKTGEVGGVRWGARQSPRRMEAEMLWEGEGKSDSGPIGLEVGDS